MYVAELRKIIKEELQSVMNEMPVPDDAKAYHSEKANNDAYIITLPNNAEGAQQLKALRIAFKNEGILRAWGRHSNRKELLGAKYKPDGGGKSNYVPLKDAEWWAIYLRPRER